MSFVVRTFGRCLSFVAIVFVIALLGGNEARGDTPEAKLERAVDELLRAQDVPGLVVEIVSERGVVYSAHRGFEDVAAKRPTTRTTPFELASSSEAFTAVAITLLENEGKLSLTDPVSKYLPWFWMRYGAERPSISIGQLLHHTSGVPKSSIVHLRATSADTALEEVARALVGTELQSWPGQAFARADVNYDLLGLMIQVITGTTYERYISEQILTPLGLHHTFVGKGVGQSAPPIGYKKCFGRWCRFDAPEFRGNTPAAYVISTPEDMVRWAQMQLQLVPMPPALAAAIERTHVADPTVLPDPHGAFYAGGWSVIPVANRISSQSGANPSFSSFVGLSKGDKYGVIVLANANSADVQILGDNIVKLLVGHGWPLQDAHGSTSNSVDLIASVLGVIAAVATLALLGLTLAQIRDILRGRRRFVKPKVENVLGTLVALGLLGFFGLCLYGLPRLLFDGFPLSLAMVWGPETLPFAMGSLGAAGCAVFLYYALASFTTEGPRVYGWLTVFSAVSGIGNALMIVVINETFVRQDNLRNGLLPNFVLGLILYIVGQRFLRRRVIRLTNDLLLKERQKLLHDIQSATFQEFEKLNRGELVATIGGDIDVISSSIATIVTGLTHAITILCCFAYLAFMNLWGFLIAGVVVGVSAWGHILAGNTAEAKWEVARDTQSRFFALLNQLLDGFKELKLDRRKHAEFHAEIDGSCREYKVARVQGDLRLADVFVVGELLLMSVLGVIAFVYPYQFPGTDRSVVRNFVVVFLYMVAPVDWVLNSYPLALRIRISWKRIQAMSKSLVGSAREEVRSKVTTASNGDVHLEVRDLEFEYTDAQGRTFNLGPVSLAFSSGQVSFITGGNGSGKSTFAKLLSGLYAPARGEVLLNGRPVGHEALGEHISAIFSDFHLFDRLYGIDVTGRKEEIDAHLRRLQLDGVVAIEDGRFSRTRLSTGQRRRLALLVSYLEDRPICLYDEWAAEQDPQYREYFYQTILPELRARGKCVIVITHDDRYFSSADQLVKFDLGRVTSAGPVSVRSLPRSHGNCHSA